MRNAIIVAFIVGALPGCAPMGASWTPVQSPKTLEVAVGAESYVVKLDAKGKALRAGQDDELAGFLASLGDLSEVEFSVRRTHKGLPVTALEPVEKALIDAGADPRRIIRLAEIGFDYHGHWADAEIIAKRYVVSMPNCPDQSRTEIIGRINENSSNFGCATASALALQIADPKDLTGGRPLDPQPATTASSAVDRYNTDKVKPLRDSRTDKVKQ